MSAWIGVWLALWRWRWWRDAGVAVASRAPCASDTASAAALAALQARMRLVQRVAAWMPRSRCLDRALTLIEWADAHAIPAELCIGVRRVADRVQAHAWVQSGSTILDPDPESTRQFARLQAAMSSLEFDR